MKTILWSFVLLLLSAAAHAVQVIHVYVGSDNSEAYWSGPKGLKDELLKDKSWQLLSSGSPRPEVSDRLVLRHGASGDILVADAYRPGQLREATLQFLRALAGQRFEVLDYGSGKDLVRIGLAGQAPKVAYLGPNGLESLSVDLLPYGNKGKATLIFSPNSQKSYGVAIQRAKAKASLLVKGSVKPSGAAFKSALDAWRAGAKPEAVVQQAAQSYAKDAGLSAAKAKGIFVVR